MKKTAAETAQLLDDLRDLKKTETIRELKMAVGWIRRNQGTAEEIAAKIEERIAQIESHTDPKQYFPEPERARIHALTRKVTTSDEELKTLAQEHGWPVSNDPYDECYNLIETLKDLRDRYEERGKYAPAAEPTTFRAATQERE